MSDARLFPEDLTGRKFQQRNHLLHKQRLDKINSTPTNRIDNRCTSQTAKTVRRSYNKIGKTYIVTEGRILEDNIKLVNKISEITSNKAIRSYSSTALSPSKNTNKINRDKEIGRIYKDNLIFAKKLKEMTATLNVRSQKSDYELSREYIKLKSNPHMGASLRRSLNTPSYNSTIEIVSSRRRLMELPNIFSGY